jgi:FAD/FMN-containing dehydrogenase
VNDFYAALQPFSSGAVYVNNLDDEGENRIKAAYGDKYARLSGVKRNYDPDNIFRINQNIRP